MDDRLGQETGRPVWFLLTDRPTDPVRWRRLMEGVHKARAEGAQVTAQIAGRPVGVMLGIDTALNPFSIRAELSGTVAAARRRNEFGGMQDPAMRAQMLSEAPSAELLNAAVAVPPADHHALGPDVPDGRPAELRAGGKRQHRRHGARGRTIRRTRWRTITSPAGAERFLFFPIVGYNEDNLDIIHTMLTDDATILGLSRRRRALFLDRRCQRAELDADPLGARPDARAAAAAGDAGEAADQRDRAGSSVSRIAGGWRAGMKADVNVIDYRALRLHIPEVRYDLPAGGRRLMQRVDGYVVTFVAGAPVFEQGAYTGATPGKLVRAGQQRT